jgi:hypothetical protein
MMVRVSGAAGDDRSHVGVLVRALSVVVGPGYDHTARLNFLPGYVRYLADHLGLLDRGLSIEIAEAAAGQPGVTLVPVPRRQRAALLITQEFFTAADEDQRYLLVVALVQAHLTGVRQCVDSWLATVLPGLVFKPFLRAHDDQLDTATDGLAQPVARLLPTMAEWAS